MKLRFKSRATPCLDKNQTNAAINRALNSCIQIEEAKISRHAKVGQQIYFYLDSSLLEQIEQIKDTNQRLTLSPVNLANLRHYLLFNSLAQIDSLHHWRCESWLIGRSPLIFSTNYWYSDRQQPLTLFRSVIDLQGKISQQIQQELSQNPQLLARVSQAHYWLILEILAQLPFQSTNQGSRLIFCYYCLATIAICLAVGYFLAINYLLWIVSGLSVFWLLNISWRKVIVKHLKALIIYHLIDGFLANSVKKRQLGLKMLGLIII
ncbi:MAG: hypothetical protein ACFCU7_07485 [Pleurocapsa sp.]